MKCVIDLYAEHTREGAEQLEKVCKLWIKYSESMQIVINTDCYDDDYIPAINREKLCKKEYEDEMQAIFHTACEWYKEWEGHDENLLYLLQKR